MRFERLGPVGAEIPVVRVEDRAFDIRAVAPDIDGAFLGGGGPAAVAAALEAGELPELATDGLRTGAPIPAPGKIVCIGLNYSDHAAETGAAIPPEPVLFMKDPGTVVGPNDTVLIPKKSVKTDWEVELGVVIGAEARYLESHEEAAACIAGYVLCHDVSEREFQLERGGTWDKGKNAETFNPMGPTFVTADEVADPQALGLRLWVNGELKQDGTTADMIFPVLEVVRYLSWFMVLRPGDVINTGTPAGVALGMAEPRYLREGDTVELEIDGLGRQRQVMVQA